MLDPEYLKKRAQELGLGRENVLGQIQLWLDREYPGRCRAVSLNGGVLRVVAQESAVASELRMRQVDIVEAFADQGVARLAISLTG